MWLTDIAFRIIQMLKFPVMKLFTSNFTMEMIRLSMLLIKKLLDQRKKQFKLILMHPKKHLQI